MPKNIGVFIDRDGTINQEVGYVNHISRYQVYPWTAEAIRNFNEAGLKAIVVTNQAGVARGYFTEGLVNQVHEKLATEMTRAGARFDAIYYCPHSSVGELPYRQTQLSQAEDWDVERAAAEFGIDVAQSYVIGDRYGDIEWHRTRSSIHLFCLDTSRRVRVPTATLEMQLTGPPKTFSRRHRWCLATANSHRLWFLVACTILDE
jgi:D-glycero-D-manno-heptose 1,7-bisphosphate phosphatase